MGLSNKQTADMGSTITIIGGQWTMRVPEGTSGAHPRELTKGTNKGSVVWEQGWSTLENVHISGGRLVKSEHFTGLNAEIDLTDHLSHQTFTVALPADSRYLKDLIKRLPLIDKGLPIDLELKMGKKKTKTGGNTYYLKVLQNSKVVNDHYVEWSKDSSSKPIPKLMNGIPDGEERRDGWNFDKQNEFLWDKFESFFNDFCPAEVVSHDEEPPDLPDEDLEDDDVPF